MNSVLSALTALKSGKPIILVDDESRENEGDLVMAAEKITPKWVNFMIRNGSGVVCLTLTEERCAELELPLMVPSDQSSNKFSTAFTVSIEAAKGVTTGVSAFDRAKTIQVAANPHSKALDLSRPGHVFPLRAKNNGVLERPGHTEGSIDLMRLAHLNLAGVLCELMNPDGSMSRMPEIEIFAKQHDLVVLSIKEVIKHRRNHVRPENSYYCE